MEPRIQYAKTKDGIDIAYWAIGAGTPFVQMPSVAFNPTYRSWRSPEGRQWYERLSQKRTVVRYDSRGFGESQHGVTTFSLETMVLDLEAIVDRLGNKSVALFGYLTSGPAAIAYAVEHPERVSHVILWCSSAKGADYISTIFDEDVFSQLRAKDWRLYTETLALSAFGWAGADQARGYAASLRETTTPEAVQAVVDAISAIDVTHLLSDVSSPTLVLHRSEVTAPRVDASRQLASQIPNAQFMVLAGDSIMPYVGDTEAAFQAIESFLDADEKTGPASSSPTGLVTILFTDMESSTALTQRLGDTKAQELVRLHNAIVRDALKAHGGSEIKHTGDGIMASFTSASGALECAVDIQQGLALRQAPASRRTPQGGHAEPVETSLRVRIGLNAGEPIAEERDLFGTAVQLARRICDQAGGGEVLASDVVRQLAAGKGFLFSDRGETALRGFEDPMKLWEVRWQEED